jgi:hypothetical protein
MKDKIVKLINNYNDEMDDLDKTFESYERMGNREMQCYFDGRYAQLSQVINDLERLIKSL